MMSGVSKCLGLPLSVQFVGRAHDEATLLRVAAGYERATQWSAYRPPADGLAEREPQPHASRGPSLTKTRRIDHP